MSYIVDDRSFSSLAVIVVNDISVDVEEFYFVCIFMFDCFGSWEMLGINNVVSFNLSIC
jgi:hypothetical protein